MKDSIVMLLGLAVGLAIGVLCSMRFGIMALPLCGCIGMALGLMLGRIKKDD